MVYSFACLVEKITSRVSYRPGAWLTRKKMALLSLFFVFYPGPSRTIQGMDEVEAKYSIADQAEVRESLQAAGAEYLGKALQTDQFYDTPQGDLGQAGCGLRIRRLKILDTPAGLEADSQAMLTFKGPVQANVDVKIRREVETKIDSAEAMAEIIQASAGFERICTIQKRRESYSLGPCRVELDELPLLGFFVEIEGPRADIERTRKLLGIAGAHISGSYLGLLREQCRKMDTDATSITFERFP